MLKKNIVVLDFLSDELPDLFCKSVEFMMFAIYFPISVIEETPT